MPQVWEDFVYAWARELHAGYDVEKQHSFSLFSDRETPKVTADVVVMSSPRVLYDAKYKPVAGTPSADDVYQMVTYCERLGLTEATLVHPGSSAATSASVGERRIHTLELNVGSKNLVSAQIHERSAEACPVPILGGQM